MGKAAVVVIAVLGMWGCGSDDVPGNPEGGLSDGGLPDATSDYQPPDPPPGCTPATSVTASCANGFCAIPAGCFLMGSPPTDPCRDDDEVHHWVTLTHAFEISATEVTQDQFAKLMGYNPSKFTGCGATCPVESVTWHQAAAYANALSSAKGLNRCYICNGSGAGVSCAASQAAIYACPGYRLPTEAEFEYAYRAGTTTAFYNGGNVSCYDEDPGAAAIAWYSQNAGGAPHVVGQKQANGFGLYDMAGNVEEWVHDGYGAYGSAPVTDPVLALPSESAHSARGGSWYVFSRDVRAADRNQFAGSDQNSYFGFRVVRTR